MNYLNNILDCDRKKLNHIGPKKEKKRKKSKAQRARKPQRKDLINIDASAAPEEKDNMCVWKWDKIKDCYYYKGCKPSLQISQGLPQGIMNNFFKDIKNVDYYSHLALFTYINDKFLFWCCVFYIPFLIYSYLVASRIWDGKFKELLDTRKAQIVYKMREFEKKVLFPINRNLQLSISTNQGYITLIENLPDNQHLYSLYNPHLLTDKTGIKSEVHKDPNDSLLMTTSRVSQMPLQPITKTNTQQMTQTNTQQMTQTNIANSSNETSQVESIDSQPQILSPSPTINLQEIPQPKPTSSKAKKSRFSHQPEFQQQSPDNSPRANRGNQLQLGSQLDTEE